MSARSLLLAFLITTAIAGESSIDPWTTLDPRHQFTCLAALRAPLDATPHDQRLLGLAITCYVHLSLPAPRLLTGDHGSLLACARTLRARRVESRHSTAPIDLASALPELWLDAVSGDTKAAMDGLSRFADAEVTADPVARALRAFATRDWRGLHARKGRTPLENYALAWALAACGANPEDRLAIARRGLSPALAEALGIHRQQQWSKNHAAMGAAIVADACWLLGSPTLSDADASALARRFAEIAHWTIDQNDDREVLRHCLITAARSLGEDDVHPLVAAWWLCDRLSATANGAGLMDGNHHRLAGLADAARWNRDRLLPVMIACAGRDTYGSDISEREKNERALIATTAGDHLPTSWSALRWAYGDADPAWVDPSVADADSDTRQAALTALAHELASGTGHGDVVLWDLLAQLAATGPVGDLPQRLAAHRDPGIIQRLRWCAVIACGGGEPDAAFRQRLANWIARDPWDPDLHCWQKLWSPSASRLAFASAPASTWTDAVVDNSRLPWPQASDRQHGVVALSERLLIRWDGWIRLPQAGRWRFAVSSDDGARLTVGDAVVDNWRYQGLTTCRVSWDCPAGWLPLRLEYFQGRGDAGCKLLWRPPGTTDDRVVPAEFLAHGPNHVPGLTAACWRGHADPLVPLTPGDDDTWLRVRPWLTNVGCAHGRLLASLGQWAAAVPWLEPADSNQRNTPFFLREYLPALGYCLLMRDPPDPARAIAILAMRSSTFRNNTDEDGPRLLADRAAAIGAGEALVTAFDKPDCRNSRWKYDHSWHVMHGLGVLRQGDFPSALADRRWLIDQQHRDAVSPDLLRLFALEALVTARLSGVPPDSLDDLDTLLSQADIASAPGDALAHDYLTGRCDAAAAATRAAQTPQPTAIGYWLGLQALAEHRFTEARAHFTTAASGTGTIALSAAALSAWLERQTATALDALPRSAPIPPRKALSPTTPATRGADDF